MNYLNQNLEKRDIPPGQLMQESDNRSIVFEPDFFNGRWSVMFASIGQPYPSRQFFDNEADALEWARELAEHLNVTLRTN